MLQATGLQGVGHNLATEQQQWSVQSFHTKWDDVYKVVCKLQSTTPRALPFCRGERERTNEMTPWRQQSLDQNGRSCGKSKWRVRDHAQPEDRDLWQYVSSRLWMWSIGSLYLSQGQSKPWAHSGNIVWVQIGIWRSGWEYRDAGLENTQSRKVS